MVKFQFGNNDEFLLTLPQGRRETSLPSLRGKVVRLVAQEDYPLPIGHTKTSLL
jgi:hypothetical protein